MLHTPLASAIQDSSVGTHVTCRGAHASGRVAQNRSTYHRTDTTAAISKSLGSALQPTHAVQPLQLTQSAQNAICAWMATECQCQSGGHTWEKQRTTRAECSRPANLQVWRLAVQTVCSCHQSRLFEVKASELESEGSGQAAQTPSSNLLREMARRCPSSRGILC